MIRLKWNLLSFLLIAFFSNLTAQDKWNIEHTIQSEAFDTERKIRVLLPDRYFRDTTHPFIVTYVLDAQYDQFWNMAKSNIDYMVDSYTVIPMIVVGIVSEDRGEEFTPPSAKLKEHLEKEVFPLIEKTYRVNNFRTIVGHSWAGAFTGHTLFSESRDMFDAYVSISPSMGYNDNMIMQMADSVLQTKPKLGKFYYCSSGDLGSRELLFGSQVAMMDSIIRAHPNETLAWVTAKFEGMDHWSCVIPSFNDGLVSMSRNYFPDQKIMGDISKKEGADFVKEMEAFYDRQQELFGFTFEPSPNYLRFVASDFIDLGYLQNATILFQWVLEKDPDNLKAAIGMANAYLEMEDTKSSVTAINLIQELLDKQKDSVSQAYYDNVSKWVKDKLEELRTD